MQSAANNRVRLVAWIAPRECQGWASDGRFRLMSMFPCCSPLIALMQDQVRSLVEQGFMVQSF
jgi:hypothetical protein